MNKVKRSIIAVFDFDGTLTYRDSLIPFLIFLFGRMKVFYGLFRLIPKFLKYLIGYLSRQQMKEAILTLFLAGLSAEKIKERGALFATRTIPKLLRPEALKRIQWHLEQGHPCILISANINLYLESCGKAMGFHQVICSQCQVSDKGLLTGKLQGINCWGAEKVNRLYEVIGPFNRKTLYVYGDSKGDREMLELADYPFYRTLGNSISNITGNEQH